MRKNIILFLIMFTPVFLAAQSTTQWQQIYGGPGVEVGYSVKTCLGQGYVVAGSSSSLGPTDGYIVRTDSLGLSMWEKYYGGINIDVIRAIELLPDSGFILAGYTNSFGNGGYDGWVLRLDKNGDTLWTRTIGTTDWDFFYDVTVTFDTGFVLAGGTYGLGNGDEDMYFVKLNSLGDTVWTRTWGGLKQDEARAITETEDSLLVACGHTFSLGDSLGDSWILRLDGTDGDTLWTRKSLYSVGADKAMGIASGTGRFGVVGQYTTSTGDLNAYVHVMFLDSITQLSLTAGISGYEYYSDIVFLTTSYNFATFGSTENDGGGSGDFFMFHDVDYSAHSYGTTDIEAGYGIDVTANKGYIACGYTEGFNSVISNMYLVKIDSTGLSSMVLAIRNPSTISGSVSVFPNPVQSSAIVTLDTPDPISGELQMSVYDISGRCEMNVPSQDWSMNSGNSATCQFSTEGLANGVYHYVITEPSGNSYTGKLVVAH